MFECFAFFLIAAGLRLLPVSSSAREGILRGLREQRTYDRYAAYCGLTGNSSLPFDRWREVWQTLRIKSAGAEAANARLRAVRRIGRVA